MPKLIKGMIPVHYAWIGPPSESVSSGIVGHDINAMSALWTAVAKDNKHQIFFWCLDEFVAYYKTLLSDFIVEKENPIQICSIEAFLSECIEKSPDDDLAAIPSLGTDAELVILFMRYFLNLNTPGSSISDTEIADRVSCKELFFLFLLRSVGGYVLDTNVGPGSIDDNVILEQPASGIQFMLPVFNQKTLFKHWMLKKEGRIPLNCFECWALYSSGESDITSPMVSRFVTFAGYAVSGHRLIKASILPAECETYLKKEDIALLGKRLLSEDTAEGLVRMMMQNIRGIPIMLTITAPIRRSHAAKSVFFAPELSPVQFIKAEHSLDDAKHVIASELNIIKMYNNSHTPKLEKRDTDTKLCP